MDTPVTDQFYDDIVTPATDQFYKNIPAFKLKALPPAGQMFSFNVNKIQVIQ